MCIDATIDAVYCIDIGPYQYIGRYWYVPIPTRQGARVGLMTLNYSPSTNLLNRGCLPPVCVPSMILGVGFQLGAMVSVDALLDIEVALSTELSFGFNYSVTANYGFVYDYDDGTYDPWLQCGIYQVKNFQVRYYYR
eukprot:241831-Pyramimonas_sp.AAC.1